jgi:hypothetical protein
MYVLSVLLLYPPISEHQKCCLACGVRVRTGDFHQAGEPYRTTRTIGRNYTTASNYPSAQSPRPPYHTTRRIGRNYTTDSNYPPAAQSPCP